MKVAPAQNVFRNFATRRPTPNRVLRQQKPNVGSYFWQPQRATHYLDQPWERGSFFANVGRSGTGMVGTPNDPQASDHSQFIGQPAISLENAKAITRHISNLAKNKGRAPHR